MVLLGTCRRREQIHTLVVPAASQRSSSSPNTLAMSGTHNYKHKPAGTC